MKPLRSELLNQGFLQFLSEPMMLSALAVLVKSSRRSVPHEMVCDTFWLETLLAYVREQTTFW
jgi:hypothetical protein